MNTTRLSANRFTLADKIRLPQNLARGAFFKALNQLQDCHLTITDPLGTNEFGDKNASLRTAMTIHNKSAYTDFIFGGSLAVAESYIKGDWDCRDLTKLVRIFSRNMDVVSQVDSGLMSISAPILRFFHNLNRNTRKGSRQNIQAHYDLGNDFFELFLDKTMMYSAAIYESEEQSLYDAQNNKLKVICDKLELGPQDHLLEIGTGWGALALYAAENYGCQVTTTTLSDEQFRKAEERIQDKGLSGKVEVLLQDYRDLKGRYDKIVSVEMVEAVGHEFLPTYFENCSRLLKENGLFLMQLITIPGQRYDRARREIDFIKRYIFPGSCIPSVERVLDCVQKKSDMRLTDLSDYTHHYARTLRHWHEQLDNKREEVLSLADERFLRMWKFYFSYCEGGFAENIIGSAHMLFSKPSNRTGALEEYK